MVPNNQPAILDEDRWLKVKPKAVMWFMAVVAVAVGSWGTIKFDMITLRRDVTEHSQALEHISEQLKAIENDARLTRESAGQLDRKVGEAAIKAQYSQEMMSQKLDLIMAEKRGIRNAP